MVKKVENFEDSSSCSILRKEFNNLVEVLYTDFKSVITEWAPFNIKRFSFGCNFYTEIYFFFDAVANKIGVFSGTFDLNSDKEIPVEEFDDLLIFRPLLYVRSNNPDSSSSHIKKRFRKGNFEPGEDLSFVVNKREDNSSDVTFEINCLEELRDFLLEQVFIPLMNFEFKSSPFLNSKIGKESLRKILFTDKSKLSWNFNYSRSLYILNKFYEDSAAKKSALEMFSYWDTDCGRFKNKKESTVLDLLEDEVVISVFEPSRFDRVYHGVFSEYSKRVDPSHCSRYFRYPNEVITLFLLSYFCKLLKECGAFVNPIASKRLSKAEKLIQKCERPVFYSDFFYKIKYSYIKVIPYHKWCDEISKY